MTSLILRIANTITRYMGVLILVCSALALWKPETFQWVAPYVTPLLGCIMFGMGMTLRLKDFSIVFSQPRALLQGLLAQFVCMPILAFVLCNIFVLPPDLAMGVILVGTAPGGTAANVLAFIAKGDVPYSVALTSLSTLVSLVLMPVLTWLLGGVWIPVDMAGLFVSILKIVVAPVLLGIVAHRYFSGLTSRALPLLPPFSALTVTLVVAGIIAINAQNILHASTSIFLVVVCHNLLGTALGYVAGRMWKFDAARCRAMCFVVGTRNSGLATALALTHFSPVSAIAGALYSVWQNLSGALISNFFHGAEIRQNKP